MAGTQITQRQAFHDDHVVQKLIEQVNKLIDDFDAQATKLDGEANLSQAYPASTASKIAGTDG